MGERTAMLSTILTCCAATVNTAQRIVRPRRVDHEFLANLEYVPPPKAETTVEFTALTQATLSAPTSVITEGVASLGSTVMGMSTFVVRHPEATFLVDPALCAGVHERVLPELPFPMGHFVGPDRPVTGLTDILATVGLTSADLDFVLPTHLHWDHVSGLYEIPGWVPIRVPAAEYTWAMTTPHAPLGVARGPLRGRVFDLYELTGPPVLTFRASHDLFGDGSVIIVDLGGHTPGSVGVLLAVEGDRRILLAGDAVWSSLQIRLLREKAPMPGELVDADRDATFEVIHRLHALPPTIRVIPSHDRRATARQAPK
ncbi:MBL fold metallo-hydrolase [Nocardia camponoti]|nr:MBL fold metallo-hydrolase [Nocardia camponoti]